MNEKLLKIRSRIFDPKKPLHTILPIVLCVAIVAGVIYIANAIGVYTVDEPIYRFDTGARLDYVGRTSFERDDESGEITIKNKGEKAVLDGAPIYFTDDPNKMLLPTQMAVIYPKARTHGRSGFNMEINREGQQITAIVRSNTIDVSKAFLYDGNNTYVFLEPMTIIMGMQEIELPAYSYAYVYYNLRIELYSPDESVNIVLQTGDVQVLAIAKDLSYQIDLSKDILHTVDGEILLISDPSILNYVTAETGKSPST